MNAMQCTQIKYYEEEDTKLDVKNAMLLIISSMTIWESTVSFWFI